MSSAALVLRPTPHLRSAATDGRTSSGVKGLTGLPFESAPLVHLGSLTGPFPAPHDTRRGTTTWPSSRVPSGSRCRVNLTAPIRTRRRAHVHARGWRRRTRATPSRTSSCSRRRTWSARTRSTSAPPTRDARFVELVHEVTATNPAFLAGGDVEAGEVGLVQYLRETMLMRSAAVVMAAEYVAAGGAGGRSVVARALQRADEPAEMLGYWLTHARPQPADAGQARRRRRGASALHRAGRAALRRPRRVRSAWPT